MVAVFDSSVVIDYLRDEGDIIPKLECYSEVYLPITVCAELLFGAANSGNPIKHQEKVLEFISRSRILPIEMKVAHAYVEVRKHLKNIGKPIPENDIWIAATAHAYDMKFGHTGSTFRPS